MLNTYNANDILKQQKLELRLITLGISTSKKAYKLLITLFEQLQTKTYAQAISVNVNKFLATITNQKPTTINRALNYTLRAVIDNGAYNILIEWFGCTVAKPDTTASEFIYLLIYYFYNLM